MNLATLDPTKIKDLSSDEKTNLYIQLKNKKEELTRKLTEAKTKKEMLEKNKEEIQNDLFNEAGVSNMEDLISYVKNLQAEFDKALEEETILVSDTMNKLNL